MNSYDSRPRKVRAGILEQSVSTLLDAQREAMDCLGGSAPGSDYQKITVSGVGGWSSELQRNRGVKPGYAGSFQPGKGDPSMPFEWKILGYSPEGQPTTVEGRLEGLGEIEVQCKTQCETIEYQRVKWPMWLQRSLGRQAGVAFFATRAEIWPGEGQFFVSTHASTDPVDTLQLSTAGDDEKHWREYVAERYVERDLARACEILDLIQLRTPLASRSDSTSPDYFKFG